MNTWPDSRHINLRSRRVHNLAYLAGWDARRLDLPATANPHNGKRAKTGFELLVCWHCGWYDARGEALARPLRRAV